MSKKKPFDLSDYLNSPEVNAYVSNLEAQQRRARQAALPTSPQQIEHVAGLDSYSNDQLRQIGNDAAAERNTNWATDRWNSVRGGVGQLFSMVGTAMDDPAAAAGATGVAAADAVLSGPLRLASQVSKWAGGDGSLPFDADKGAQFIHESLLPAMQYWGDKLADSRNKNDADNAASSAVRGVGQLISEDAQASMSPQAKQRNAQYEATKGFGALGFLATNPTKALDMVLENLPSQLPMLGAGRAAGSLSNIISENAGKAAAAEAMMTPQFRAAMAIGNQKAKDAAMATVQAAAKDAVEAAAAKSAPILTGLNVALEAGTTGAQTTDAIFNAVANAKQDDIAKNPVYQQLLKETGSDSAARNKLAGRLSAEWAPLASFGTAFGSLVTGGAHAEAQALAGHVAGYKEAAKGVGKEMLEEAIQNPLEDAAQYGAERQVNPNAKYDPIKSALEGAVVSMGHSGAVQFAKPVSDSVRGIVGRYQAQTATQPQDQPTQSPVQAGPMPPQVQPADYDPIAPNQDDLLRRMGVQPDPVADAAVASVESALGAGDPTAGLVASVMRGDALQPVHDLAAVRAQQVLQPTASEGGLFEPKWLPDAAGGESIDGLPLPKYGVDSQEKRLANMGLDARDAQQRQAIDAHKQASFAAIDAMIARQKAAELEQLHQDSVVPATIDRAETANQINQALADAAGEGVIAPNAMQLALQAAQQKAMPAKAVTANTVPGNNATFKAAPNISAAAPNIAEEAPNISRDDNSRQLTQSDASIDSNASPALTMQQTERGQWLIKGDMAQHVQAIREALPGTKLVVSQQKGQALVQMPADKNTAKQGKQIRKALDHLLLSGEQLAQRDAQRMAAGERMKAQNQQARQIDHGSDDILQAVAKLGGINTEQALSEWWRGQPETIGHYNGEIPGNLRRQGVFAFKRQGGLPIDDMVRRLEGEGYLHDGATPNDLLDAIEQRRLHPAGMEQRARQEYEARQQEEAPGEFQQAYHDGEFADEFTRGELDDATDYFELGRQQREAIEAAAEAADDKYWNDVFDGKGAFTPTEEQLDAIFGPEKTSRTGQAATTAGANDAGRTTAGAQSVQSDEHAESAQDGFGLASYTASDLQRQEREAEQRRVDDERQRAAADKARQDEETRKEIRRRSEAAADTFVLGGNAEDNLTGQGGLFDAPVKTNNPDQKMITKSDGSGFATREALRAAATRDGIPQSSLIEKRDEAGNWIGLRHEPDNVIDRIITDESRAGKVIGTSIRDLHSDDVYTLLMAASSKKQINAIADYIGKYAPRAAADAVKSHIDSALKQKGWATEESLYGGGLFDAPAETEFQRLKRGKVGMMLAPGEVVLTTSGRETTPFPKFQTKTGKTTTKHISEVDKWLLQNAANEALSRGDTFNAPVFQSAADNPKNISPSDKDSAEEYLFGEQPAVKPSILKPLSVTNNAESQSSSAEKTAHSPGKAPDLAPNAASSAEMDSLKAEMGDAIGELASLLGVRKNLTAEEEAKIIPVMAKIFRIAAKMGYIQFKEAGRYVIQQIRQIGGDELANKLSIDNLQAGYINIAKEIGGDKREALAYESIHELEGEPQQGANESQSDNSESATDTTAPSLVDKFAGEIANGNMPKDNNALRKMVAVMDGKQPDAFRMKQAQEDLEAAIVVAARSKVAEGGSTRNTFNRLVDLYQSQPNLNIRTSTSIANQAYSTPAPLAYVAAKLADITSSTHVFEPTAGNGMLLLTAEPHNATANELDDQRFANLQAQGFDAMQGNALEAVTSGAVAEKSQDAVITNPPFGSVKDDAGKATKVNVDGYKIGKIDHLIAADALRTMKDDGKAVLIIGADKVAGGLSTDDRIFFNWLYSHYNVTHHFEVDGSLYSRQGASWPVRVIALNGRVESNGISPKAGTVERVSTWEQVYGQLEQGLVSQDRRIDRNAASSADGSVPGTTAANEQVDPPVVAGGKTQQRNNVGRTRGTAGAADVGGRGAGAGRNTEQLPAEGMGAADSAQRRNESATGQIGLESGNPERVQASATAGSDQPSGNSGANRVTTLADAENAYQARYVPASSRKDDGVLIPVNMAQPLSDALAAMEDETGNIDQFAAKELGYRSVGELHQALMGLQVDSVATAVRNLKNGNGTIIADQTGIGKGRQAAAIIRWAVKNGRIPVFVTVKPALFTDMYNDLADIGSHDIAPFILNVDESISGASGNKLFANKKATHKQNLNAIANSGTLPDDTNAVFMTYSQINTANIQRSAIAAIAPRAIFVLDESHNAGGESATGEYIKGLLDTAPGVVYLSATYAKRPDNMPLYFRTDIGKAIADDSALKDAMANGGLPLQTVVSNNLVKAGQMFRRERSYDGISISTVVDSANKERHVELADKVTSALRAIVSADKAFHENYFEAVKKALEEEGKDAYDNAGNQAGKSVDHSEFSSVVHNFVRQLLLGLKADAAADHAIAALKRGEKPLIALENTMGSFLSEYAAGAGIQVGKPLGDFDYRTVLSRALKRSRYIQVNDGKGNKSKQYIGLEKLDPVTRLEYDNAQEVIDSLDVADIPVSPLDWIRYRLQKAGYSVAEITGRDLAVDYSKATPVLANVPSEEQSDKVLTTRRFNSGKLDAIILNVSGSTGISLHASEKFSDKRPRHMIVAQPAQDINIFMQMLGRIHRTGQVVLPDYTILNVDLPAEKRPTALLSKKMKSLNANTSSNTESATSVQSVDILNKYGDQVVADYLQENIDLAQAMNIEVSADAAEDIARRVTGRLALMPVETQHRFYSEVEEQYQSLIDYLNKTNQNDLEPRTFDFDAKETRRETLVKASGESPFEQAADYIEFSIKAQGKAMTPDEIKAEISDNLQGKQPSEHAADMVASLNEKYQAFVAEQQSDSAREKAAGAKMAGERFILQHPIGSTWRVEINDDHYNAVIINIKNSHKSAGNPFSLSKTTVTIAVNGSLRQVSVPATQFEKITTSQIYSYGPYQASVDRYFSSRVADERETAKMITGNLLAAYGELSGVHGTIVNFSRADGSVDQGILLPKRFDFKQNTSGDYRFKSGSDAYKFLRESNSKGVDKIGVQNREQTVRVTLDSNGIAISVPKSKAKGGKYFGDTALTKITGDFVSAGGMMNAYVDKQNAEAAIDTLIKKTALYAIPSMAEEARKIVGDEMPEPTASVESTGNKLNSKANDHTQGMSAKDLQAIIAKVLPAHLRERVKVAQSRSNNAQQSARSEDRDLIEAEYDPATGQLTLYADAIPTPERALFVLDHELTHYGLDKKYGVGLSSILLEARNNPMIAKLAAAIAVDRSMTVNSVRQDIADALGVPVARIARSAAIHRLQVETANEALAELNAAIERNDFAYLQDRYGVVVPKMMRNDLRGRLSRLAASVKAWLAKLTGKQSSEYSDKQVWDLLAGVRETVRGGGKLSAGYRDGAAQHSMAASSKTINVDGVTRPTTNSNGKPIAQTEEGLRNFWRWFGDSKVVDKNGKPLVVYHGTESDFDSFDQNKVKTTKLGSGFYFAKDPETANLYAGFSGSNVVPVYLRMERPLIASSVEEARQILEDNGQYMNIDEFRGTHAADMADVLAKAGFDGIMYDGVMVVQNPTQIKSAVGNQGTFNGSDPNILRSTAPKQPASAGFSLPEETKTQTAQREVQDNMNRWKQVLENVREQGGQVDERNDVYGAEERLHGRAATRIEDFAREEVEPLMQRLADMGRTLQDIELFLKAQHAPEANARIREIDDSRDTAFGMEDGEAQSILAKFAALPDAAEFKRLANDFRAIADGTLALYEQAGIVSPETAIAMHRAYQHYVPVKGGDEDQAARQGTGKGLSVNGKQKRRMGHDMRDEHVLENLMRDRQRAIILAEKNNVGTYLLDLIQRNPDPKLWTIDVLPKQKVLRNQVSFAVERNGQIIDSFTDIDAAERFIDREVLRGAGQAGEFNIMKSSDPYVSMMAKPMMQENEVQVYVKGQPVRIQLHDPILARQYRRMGSEQLGRLVEAGKAFNRWLSQAYTGYNPRFFVKNVARDAIAGTINLTAEQGAGMTAKALMHWPKAGATVFKFVMSGEVPKNEYGRALKRYRAAGGSTGAAYMGDLERQANTLNRLYENYTGAMASAKDGKPGRAAKIATRKLVGGLAHWFEVWNSAGENAFRLATFMAMEESGKTVAQSASMAKNVTVNFNRKGELTPQLGAAYLFLNPSVQGSQRMIQSLFGANTAHKAQAWALVGGMVGLALALAAMNRADDDDEWESIPNSVKDHNMIIPLGKGRKLTIPLPYDYSFFVSLANRLDAVMHGESADKAAIKLASSFFESFSPVGNPIGEEPDGKNVINVMPTVVKMVLQPAFNINGFGSPMRPDESKDDMPDNLKMYHGTRGSAYDKAAQLLSAAHGSPYENNWNDVSPETLKYWTQALTGGTGKFLADSASLLNVLAAGALPEGSEVPIYDTLVRETTVKDARARFYDLGKDAKGQVEAWRRAMQAGDSKAASEYEQHDQILALGQMMDGYRQQATALRDLMAHEMQRDDLTLAEKRLKQKMYERQEADIYQEFIRQFKPH